MAILFYDTETTGMAMMKDSPAHPDQPRIVPKEAVSITTRISFRPNSAQILATAQSKLALVVQVLQSSPIKLEGAAAIHGITTEEAERHGVPIGVAMVMFGAMLAQAHTAVAHNQAFDDHMIAVEESHGIPVLSCKFARVCTMLASVDVCKLPGPYGYKWPKLTEAHQILVGRGFEGAHDALADVMACARVYFALRKLELV